VVKIAQSCQYEVDKSKLSEMLEQLRLNGLNCALAFKIPELFEYDRMNKTRVEFKVVAGFNFELSDG
jgi:hypothetical protein